MYLTDIILKVFLSLYWLKQQSTEIIDKARRCWMNWAWWTVSSYTPHPVWAATATDLSMCKQLLLQTDEDRTTGCILSAVCLKTSSICLQLLLNKLKGSKQVGWVWNSELKSDVHSCEGLHVHTIKNKYPAHKPTPEHISSCFHSFCLLHILTVIYFHSLFPPFLTACCNGAVSLQDQ